MGVGCPLSLMTHCICAPPRWILFLSLTCSCPRMMTPPDLMGCQAARLSPLPSFSPFWYASHWPSRVVQEMQMWCHFPSRTSRGSWATCRAKERQKTFILWVFVPRLDSSFLDNLHFIWLPGLALQQEGQWFNYWRLQVSSHTWMFLIGVDIRVKFLFVFKCSPVMIWTTVSLA